MLRILTSVAHPHQLMHKQTPADMASSPRVGHQTHCHCPCFACSNPAADHICASSTSLCPNRPLATSPPSLPPQRAEQQPEPPVVAATATEPKTDATDEQLSRKVKRTLSLSEEPVDKCVEEEEESTSEEVGELAGYLGELYLPRRGVSADAALMADLMYT